MTQSSTIINAHHVSQASVQSPCAHHVSPRAGQIVNFCATRKPARAEKTSNLKLSRCQRLSQRAGARQRDFSHGCRGRGVRYSGTVINAHHVSQACVQSPCANHVSPRAEQIVNLTPSRCQRLSQRAGARRRLFARPVWPRRTLLWHDYQRASRKPSVRAVALCASRKPASLGNS